MAEALGTSPQTVRTLLRKGELRGQKVAWGTRYVWTVSQEAVDEFLAEHGRLDGRRRSSRSTAPGLVQESPAVAGDAAARRESPPPGGGISLLEAQDAHPYTRPFVLRPRGRATVVVLVVGVPLLVAYIAARLLPGALWFEEVGHQEVFTQLVAIRTDFYLRVVATVAAVVAVNLSLALLTNPQLRTRTVALGIVAAALVTGTLFAGASDHDWQTYALWRHRQPFGTEDPVHGKDLEFFVFSLPFHLVVTQLLMMLLLVTAAIVVAVYIARGRLSVRPLEVTFGAQLHLSCIAALFLLVVAWRLHLEQYLLELGQPTGRPDHSFAGAGYVDLNVRAPTLTALTVIAIALAAVCVALPFLAGTRYDRPAHISVGVTAALLAVGIGLVGNLTPALVQRYLVDPNPLLSEQQYLERTIAATRAGLGIDTIDVDPYTPPGRFSAADYPAAEERLARVPAWDSYILGARMRQLASEPAFYRPGAAVPDLVERNGRTELTTVSARELDIKQVPSAGDSWSSDRLSYTHGLGLVRYSSTDIAPNRQPRLLDSGLQVEQPRIYFGNLPEDHDESGPVTNEARLLTPTLDEKIAQTPWVLANTRRAEVDIPVGGGVSQPYHYDGTGGIELSSWTRRVAFALALENKELLLSDDITPDSRLLLHRDVHERLRTLAPFLTWDSTASPLTVDGRIVYRRQRLHHKRQLPLCRTGHARWNPGELRARLGTGDRRRIRRRCPPLHHRRGRPDRPRLARHPPDDVRVERPYPR